MKRLIAIFTVLPLVFISCKKETVSLLTQQVNSNTGYGLYDVFFIDDSIGYACGGDQWTMGQFIYTRNGGQTWSQPDSVFPECAYVCQFFTAAEGLVAGNVSNVAYTVDSGKTFAKSISNYKAILDMVYIDRQHAVKVGGQGYADGYIAYSADGGSNWVEQTYLTAMNAVSYGDSNTVYVAGYGVVYKSTDKGATFTPLDTRGDNFVSCCFVSSTTGYVAGYEGLILKTTDGGNSFKKVRKGNAPFSHREYLRHLQFWDENTGYVVGDGGLMYKTVDGGDNWMKVEEFTSANLRNIYLFSATAGIVVGDEGKIFLFK